jgi:hypothetical protein
MMERLHERIASRHRCVGSDDAERGRQREQSSSHLAREAGSLELGDDRASISSPSAVAIPPLKWP